MTTGEMIDVLNESGDVVGMVTREHAEQDNRLTQNVLIFVFNAVGKVWIQLRPMHKNHYPGLWDISACGGIMSGELPEVAARRETSEETTLDVELAYVTKFLNVFTGDDGVTRSRLSWLFIGRTEEIPTPNLEVEEFKLSEVEILRRDASKNPGSYVPSFLVELNLAVAAFSAKQKKK